MKITKRVKIMTGFKCNALCKFCYYKEFLSQPNFPQERIKRDILFALKNGIENIDFSGGEPTLHKNLPDLIYFAKKKGAKSICIITNGIALANLEYYKRLKDAGLNETLFSLQGYDEHSHDFIVGVKNAFSRLMKALENAVKLGIKIRINSVIHKLNYKKALTIAKIGTQFSPEQFNFISVNDWKHAKKSFSKYVLSYSELAPYLKEACDYLRGYLENINIRYVPFCFFKDYENYICGHLQVMFDPFEWDPYVRVRLEKHYPPLIWIPMIIYGMINLDFKRLVSLNKRRLINECIIEAIRRYGYTKSKECKKCKYYYLCDGVEKKYAQYFGLKELKPIEGKIIEEPYYFRKHLLKYF